MRCGTITKKNFKTLLYSVLFNREGGGAEKIPGWTATSMRYTRMLLNCEWHYKLNSWRHPRNSFELAHDRGTGTVANTLADWAFSFGTAYKSGSVDKREHVVMVCRQNEFNGWRHVPISISNDTRTLSNYRKTLEKVTGNRNGGVPYLPWRTTVRAWLLFRSNPNL